MALDEQEFRVFYQAQFSRLYWLGYLLTGNAAQAEELAQDELVRTFGRWQRHGLDEPALYARRVLINRHRSLGRRALLELRHVLSSSTAEPAVPGPGEDRLVVWAALRQLPVRQQAVLALRYHEDLSEADVARLLGMPLGTVKTLARRGLARLRAHLGPARTDLVPVHGLEQEQ